MATPIEEVVSHKLVRSLLFCGLLYMLGCGCQCQSVPGMYVLGDSLVDVGNNNHLLLSLVKANFPHNGIDYPTGEATGRFSNGKNAADFLAEKVGLPTAPPYLSLESKWKKLGNNEAVVTGVSFASGGARISDRSNEPLLEQSISLTKQVDLFSLIHDQLVQGLGSAGAQSHLAKSLFLIVIGSNDLFGYFKKDSQDSKQYTPQQYVDLMASTLKQLIKRLYGLGARKYVVTGVGVIGCCPEQRRQNTTNGCKEETNYWSTKYNYGLKNLLQEFKIESSDINYSYFDAYAAMSDIIQEPQTHGITEIKEACCGLGNLKADFPCTPISTYCSNRGDHIFWDYYHPTETVSNIFADLLYNGSQKFVLPINVQQLIDL